MDQQFQLLYCSRGLCAIECNANDRCDYFTVSINDEECWCELYRANGLGVLKSDLFTEINVTDDTPSWYGIFKICIRKKIEINETDFLFWELMIAENFEHRLNLILIGIISVDDVKKI